MSRISTKLGRIEEKETYKSKTSKLEDKQTNNMQIFGIKAKRAEVVKNGRVAT
jgi:hypothetical protein